MIIRVNSITEYKTDIVKYLVGTNPGDVFMLLPGGCSCSTLGSCCSCSCGAITSLQSLENIPQQGVEDLEYNYGANNV